MTLEEVRQKYPQYSQIPDDVLADRLYQKYYSDKLSREDFMSKIGVSNKSPNEPPKPKESSFFDSILGGGEAALSVASSAVAEPLAGLAGLGTMINPFTDDNPAEVVKQMQQALTYEPRTQQGQAAVQPTSREIRSRAPHRPST